MSSHKSDGATRALWGVMLISAIIIITALIFLSSRPTATGELGCLNGKPNGRIAILIDKSDPFTQAQQEELENYFEQITAELNENYLVSIFLLNEPEAMNKKPTFAHCVPKIDGNPLIAAPARIKAKFQSDFGKRFSEILHGSIEPGASDKSPILEMIKRISRSYYFKEEVGEIRKLYIVSDLMQNVEDYSFFKHNMDFEEFKKSGYGKKILDDSDLNGAIVAIKIVPQKNASYERTQQLKKFWIDYMIHQGVIEFKPDLLP